MYHLGRDGILRLCIEQQEKGHYLSVHITPFLNDEDYTTHSDSNSVSEANEEKDKDVETTTIDMQGQQESHAKQDNAMEITQHKAAPKKLPTNNYLTYWHTTRWIPKKLSQDQKGSSKIWVPKRATTKACPPTSRP